MSTDTDSAPAASLGLVRWIYRFPLIGRLGLNRAVAITVATKMFQAGSQFAVIFLISKFLSPTEQGYYYTFQSLLALQVFFELGMSTVLVQVVSHESARMPRLLQDPMAIDHPDAARVGSFFRFIVRWYATISVAFVMIAIPAGIVFFHWNSDAAAGITSWMLPWILLAAMSTGSLVYQAATCLVEGLGEIADAARLRGIYAMACSIGLILSLVVGAGLYSPAISLALGLAVGGHQVGRRALGSFIRLYRRGLTAERVDWFFDLWGFQWKMAVSWLSGFFIFQFSTPALFALIGPLEAGKYGMSFQIVNGIAGLSMAWTTTRQAVWGRMIATGNWQSLDADFKANLVRTVLVNVAFALLFCLFLAGTNLIGMGLAERFSTWTVLLLLFATGTVNQVVFTQATYLRAHRREPFMHLSILSAVFIVCGVLILGRSGSEVVALIFFLSNLFVGLGGGTFVFMRCRKSWRSLQPKHVEG